MIKTTILATSLFLLPPAFSDEHGHDHKKKGHDHDKKEKAHDHEIKPPNGGRILHDIHPHAEFFITKGRKVQITFLNDHGKAVTSKATLQAIGGKRNKPTKFTFQKTKNGFLSEQKLPEGNLVPIVLTFKTGDKKKLIKFNVNMADCPTCDFLEYACTCDHVHVGEGHDHKDHDHGKKK